MVLHKGDNRQELDEIYYSLSDRWLTPLGGKERFCDAKGLAEAIEKACRYMWRRWCGKQSWFVR